MIIRPEALLHPKRELLTPFLPIFQDLILTRREGVVFLIKWAGF